jgi:hypothetical protein
MAAIPASEILFGCASDEAGHPFLAGSLQCELVILVQARNLRNMSRADGLVEQLFDSGLRPEHCSN